jgi:hypothetical protein
LGLVPVVQMMPEDGGAAFALLKGTAPAARTAAITVTARNARNHLLEKVRISITPFGLG